MCVKFGSGDGFMPQQLLYCPQISTVFEQVRGKRVTECVRTYIFMNSGHHCKFFDNGKNHCTCKFASAPIEKQKIFVPLFYIQMITVHNPKPNLLF